MIVEERCFLEWLQGPDIDCEIDSIINRFIGQDHEQRREFYLFYGLIITIIENKFLEMVKNETKSEG